MKIDAPAAIATRSRLSQPIGAPEGSDTPLEYDRVTLGVAAPGELRILLIEDSDRIRQRLTAMLTVPGQMRAVAAAATESESRAQIEAGQYDALLVDVELKQGSGIGAIRHARHFYPVARQPLIIVLTN
ncbi:MAG: response regulator [Bryobacteraceae bacterium]